MRKIFKSFDIAVIILVLLLFAGASEGQTASEAPLRLVGEWGGYGTGPGKFYTPAGIAVDDAGFMYVADYDNRRVQKLSPTGQYVTETYGKGAHLVALEPETGNVYFTDMYSLNKVTPDLQTLIFFIDFNRENLEGDQLDSFGIAVDLDKNLYAVMLKTDGSNGVRKYSADAVLLMEFGKELFEPAGVAVDGIGNVYVVDSKYNITKYTSTGVYVTKWNVHPEFGEIPRALAITADLHGNVYVEDIYHKAIKKYNTNGKLLYSFDYDEVGGIFVDRSGFVYITNSSTHKIQKFAQSVSSSAKVDMLGQYNKWHIDAAERDELKNFIAHADDNGYANIFREVLTERHIAQIPDDLRFKTSGLAADGNSKIFLRARLEYPDSGFNINNVKARFNVTGLSNKVRLESLDRKLSGNNSIVVDVVDLGDNVLQATVVMTAPVTSVKSSKNFNAVEDFTVNVSFEGILGGGSAIMAGTVYPPPVVLIHGLWGSEKSWKKKRFMDPLPLLPWDAYVLSGTYRELLDRKYTVGFFEYTPSEGPSTSMQDNEFGLYDTVQRTLAIHSEKYNIVSSQVDLVCHSMGGLVARKYLYDNLFYHTYPLNYMNYQKGNVRYLVTLGTPHNGSPLIDYLNRNSDVFPIENSDHKRAYDRISGLTHLGILFDGGVFIPLLKDKMAEYELKTVINPISKIPVFVLLPKPHTRTPINAIRYDLGTQSEFIKNLNKDAPLPPVPMYCIAGDSEEMIGGSDITSDAFKNTIAGAYLKPSDSIHKMLFNGASDSAVAVQSALYPIKGFSTGYKGGDFEHGNLTASKRIGEKVIDVLQSEPELLTSASKMVLKQDKIQKSMPVIVSDNSFVNMPEGAQEFPEALLLKPSSIAIAARGSVRFIMEAAEDLQNFDVLLEVEDAYDSALVEMTYDEEQGNYFFEMQMIREGVFKCRAVAVSKPDADTKTLVFVSAFADLIVQPYFTNLREISVIPNDSMIIVRKGHKHQIEVIGIDDTDDIKFIQHQVMGTVYLVIEGEENIFVSENGLISGLKAGTSRIRISSHGLSKEIKVVVTDFIAPDSDPDPDPEPKPDNKNINGGGCSIDMNNNTSPFFMILLFSPIVWLAFKS